MHIMRLMVMGVLMLEMECIMSGSMSWSKSGHVMYWMDRRWSCKDAWSRRGYRYHRGRLIDRGRLVNWSWMMMYWRGSSAKRSNVVHGMDW